MQAGTRERLLGCSESGQTSWRRASLNNFLQSADCPCFQCRKKAEKKESTSLLRPRFFTGGSNCNSKVYLKAFSCIILVVMFLSFVVSVEADSDHSLDHTWVLVWTLCFLYYFLMESSLIYLQTKCKSCVSPVSPPLPHIFKWLKDYNTKKAKGFLYNEIK